MDMRFIKEKEPKNGTRYAASIDIGTNTVRFLVGEILAKNNFRCVHSGGTITRLGSGLKKSGKLSLEKVRSAISTLSGFRREIEMYEPEFISVVATSAVREASNSQEFVGMVRKETGLDIEVVDWDEEARRMLLGIFWESGVDDNKESLVFDIGGGSTEFIASCGERLLKSYGTNLGVVHLSEEYLKSDPLNDVDLTRMQNAIRDGLKNIKTHFEGISPARMVCTAGTPTTLVAARLKLSPYDPNRVHNFVLTRDTVMELFNELRALSTRERKKLRWIEEGRADLILPGAQIILVAMDIFGFKEMLVSEYGLREGILLHALRKP